MDLDELLEAAAPPVTARTPGLQRELDDLVATTEASGPRRRTSVRIAVVSGAVVGVLAAGAVASAVGVLPGWLDFSTSSGQSCDISIAAKALDPGEGEPNSPSFGPAERQATLAEARHFLERYDYAAVDRTTAIAWWRAEEASVRAAQADPSERQPRLTGDDLEVTAVSRYVIEQLRTHLVDEGLDLRAISISTGTDCVL